MRKMNLSAVPLAAAALIGCAAPQHSSDKAAPSLVYSPAARMPAAQEADMRQHVINDIHTSRLEECERVIEMIIFARPGVGKYIVKRSS